jgi:mRNA interferase MazF
MPITSQLRATSALGEIWISQWRQDGLLKPAAVKPVFATFEQRLAIRLLGRLQSEDQIATRAVTVEILG